MSLVIGCQRDLSVWHGKSRDRFRERERENSIRLEREKERWMERGQIS